MRGRAKKQVSMLAFVDPEAMIPADHPLRTIKRFADAALVELSPLFDEMYAADGQGRASIPPERLLKASLLISLYSVRSERAFCEEVTYHLLFRWFLDMDLVEPSFDHSTFSKNRARPPRSQPTPRLPRPRSVSSASQLANPASAKVAHNALLVKRVCRRLNGRHNIIEMMNRGSRLT